MYFEVCTYICNKKRSCRTEIGLAHGLLLAVAPYSAVQCSAVQCVLLPTATAFSSPDVSTENDEEGGQKALKTRGGF